MAHEGGYSEVHVPFCGHAALQEMSGSKIDAGDAMGARIAGQQPNAAMEAIYSKLIDEIAIELDLWNLNDSPLLRHVFYRLPLDLGAPSAR